MERKNTLLYREKNKFMPTTTTKDQERRALEALVTDNSDLERLEDLLKRFNLFEAIGIVKQELRHSNLLAFLLNPQKNHRLGDAFVKQLLKKALSIGQDTNIPITLIDLDIWSLDNIEVRREWKNIDILLVDEQHHLAVIIENKIDTHEHSNQLQRYYQQVQKHYPKHRIIGLYLTPDGDQPSEDTYIPIDYSLICAILENLVVSKETLLDNDLRVMIQHYTQMLRRHIVSDSEIAELCQRIYKKHQQALDLIYEHRPDRQATIWSFCKNLIKQTIDLIPDSAPKRYIRFIPKAWDFSILREGQGWTSSNRILLFQFNNEPDSLNLTLVVGPGSQEIRQKLFEMGQRDPFRISHINLPPKWFSIYSYSILNKESYEGSDKEIAEQLREQWQLFLEYELPGIDAVMKAQEWLV